MTCQMIRNVNLCIHSVRSLLIIIIVIVAPPLSPDLLERMIASAFNRLRLHWNQRRRRHTNRTNDCYAAFY